MYQTKSFTELVEYMASCEKLGLPYVVQKDLVEIDKWFGRKVIEPLYTLQVFEYTEEGESVDG